MGLFGKKKTPAEILDEGMALYQQGEYSKAALTLLKASGKENGKVDYWVGRSYLAQYTEKDDRTCGKLAKQYLTFSAKDGCEDAARLLAEEFGIRDYLPEDAASQPAPKPAPAPKPQADTQPEPAGKAGTPAEKPAPAEDGEETPEEKAERYCVDAALARMLGNPALQLALMEKAAELGHAAAQFNCGIMYETGDGTEIDHQKALYWFEKSAEQGDADAQYNCAVYYDSGKGTAVDYKKALYWYQKAADQGHAMAQFNLAMMYDMGDGAPKDMKKALHWYREAAEQGHAGAQFRCGQIYYSGNGVKSDKAKAKEYFRKAAAQTEDPEVQKDAKDILRKYF